MGLDGIGRRTAPRAGTKLSHTRDTPQKRSALDHACALPTDCRDRRWTSVPAGCRRRAGPRGSRIRPRIDGRPLPHVAGHVCTTRSRRRKRFDGAQRVGEPILLMSGGTGTRRPNVSAMTLACGDGLIAPRVPLAAEAAARGKFPLGFRGKPACPPILCTPPRRSTTPALPGDCPCRQSRCLVLLAFASSRRVTHLPPEREVVERHRVRRRMEEPSEPGTRRLASGLEGAPGGSCLRMSSQSGCRSAVVT